MASRSNAKCLTCSICLELFNEPKVLPCLHTFCKLCLVTLAEKPMGLEPLCLPAEEQVDERDDDPYYEDQHDEQDDYEPCEDDRDCDQYDDRGCDQYDDRDCDQYDDRDCDQYDDWDCDQYDDKDCDQYNDDMQHSQDNHYDEIKEKESTEFQMKEFDCPQCRAHQKVRIEQLPTDHTLQKEVAVHALTVKREESNLFCSLCTRDKGHERVGYCTKCQSFVCQGCFEAHQYMTQFKDHVVIQIDKFDPEMVKSKAIYCTVHKIELLSRYCLICKLAICCECALQDHYEHQFLVANEAKTVVQNSLQCQKTELETKLKDFEHNLQEIKNVEGHVMQYPDHLIAKVNESCDIAIKGIEAARMQMVSDIKSRYAEYAKKVWVEKDTVERTVTGLQNCITFSERLLSSDDCIETLFLSKQVHGRFEELKKTSWNDDTIQLASLVFKADKIPTTVGNIVEFEGHESVSIRLKSKHVVAGSEFNATLCLNKYTEILSIPSIIVNVTVLNGPDFKLMAPDSSIKIGSLNLEEKCWPLAIICMKQGNHKLTATISVLGKVFATVSSETFTVQHMQRVVRNY